MHAHFSNEHPQYFSELTPDLVFQHGFDLLSSFNRCCGTNLVCLQRVHVTLMLRTLTSAWGSITNNKSFCLKFLLTLKTPAGVLYAAHLQSVSRFLLSAEESIASPTSTLEEFSSHWHVTEELYSIHHQQINGPWDVKFRKD